MAGGGSGGSGGSSGKSSGSRTTSRGSTVTSGGSGKKKKTQKTQTNPLGLSPQVLKQFGKGNITKVEGKPAPSMVTATEKSTRSGGELKTERTTIRGSDSLRLKTPALIESTPNPEARMTSESIKIQQANRDKGLPSYTGMSPEMAMAPLNMQVLQNPNIVNNDDFKRAKLEIEQQLAQQRADLAVQQAPLPQEQPQPQDKGFLLENLSTATGIAGGVAGSLLGPAGTVAGAGIGAGLGESVENVITGDPLRKNVAKTALIDSALTLAGFGAVKAIRYGSKLLRSGGELSIPAVAGSASGLTRTAEYTGFLTKQRGLLTKSLEKGGLEADIAGKRIEGIDRALRKLPLSESVPKILTSVSDPAEKEFLSKAVQKMSNSEIVDKFGINMWKNPKTSRAGISYISKLVEGAKNPKFVLGALLTMGGIAVGTASYWFSQTPNDTGDTAVTLSMMAREAKESGNKQAMENIKQLSADLADPSTLEGLNAINYPKAALRKIQYANMYVNLMAENMENGK